MEGAPKQSNSPGPSVAWRPVSSRRSMREQAKDHAHQGPDSIVPNHDFEPGLLKMPRFRSIRDQNPNMEVSGTQLTERTLSTLPSEEPGATNGKNVPQSLVTMMTMRPLTPSSAT